MINGKIHDWEDMHFYLDGILITGITDINYKDSQKKEHVYAAGSKPIGRGRGNLEGSGDITLTRNEYDRVNNIAKAAGKSVYDFKPFVIVVVYGAKTITEESPFPQVEDSILHTDTLQNAEFTDRDFAAKQDDVNNTVKLGLIFEPPVR
jgi:hypothetical protein